MFSVAFGGPFIRLLAAVGLLSSALFALLLSLAA
jgi:hypothetical protein|tara:strand:+ start:12218 stop:12319 length:102 start_codon:yes stop_codon:yes gene_type:complete